MSNLENVLQRNLRADRARESTFREFGSTILKMYPLGAIYGGAFVDSIYVPIWKKKKLWKRYWYINQNVVYFAWKRLKISRKQIPENHYTVVHAEVRADLKSEKLFYLLQWKSFKNDEKCFYLILKGLFVLKISKSLSWLFGYVEKTAWLER